MLFSRLTVTLTDTTSVHKLQQHPKRALFDIVAIRCLDESMLTTMARKGELFDIITMDSKQQKTRIPWIHKQKLIQACIKEGISFEVCYGEALNDSEIRRQFFINGGALVRISSKGRGIVLSSGAESIAWLRGPYDVANMCTLFGMQSNRGSKLVSDNCCHLLLRAQSRRTIKGAIHIAPIEEAPTPSNIKREDHLAALSAIPEFREQMKPRIEIVETS
jgi:ribonuclease P/MRP protein subunit RPP1